MEINQETVHALSILIEPKFPFQMAVNQKTQKYCLTFDMRMTIIFCITSGDHTEIQQGTTKTLKFLLYTCEFLKLHLLEINLYTSLMVKLFINSTPAVQNCLFSLYKVLFSLHSHIILLNHN